ncbi:MAG: carbohydrate-binding family 9-like protein [Bacteroidia bacterium]
MIRQLFPMLGTSSPSISAVRTPVPLNIDGKLEEAVYQKTIKIYLQDSRAPKIPVSSTYESFAQLAYDDTYLYVAFHCKDPDIHSSFTQRDEHLWKEEAVEVFIDTDLNDPNRYVELQVSPRNICYDSFIVDPQNIDVPKTARYNLKDFHTAVSVDGTLNQAGDIDQSWTVEMAVPWAEIVPDYDPSQLEKANWRINLYRINVDQEQKLYQAWSPTQGSFHQPQKFGHIIFR